MAKGLFTQGMCVLLRRPLELDEIQSRLNQFQLAGRQESLDDEDSPETLIYDFRPEVGGHLLVTPSSIPWPDDMGDPDESPERFVAWSLGQFGPLAFPGCLSRACDQTRHWDDMPDIQSEHTCHIRFLISYVLGTEEEDDEDEDDLPLVPDDYEAIDELHFLTKAVAAVLEAPEAICYFNPGGEVLCDENVLRQGLNHAWNLELPPLDMWTNVRVYVDDNRFAIMDTVGNGQFDLPDMEAVFPLSEYVAEDVERFLRHASLYLLAGDEEVTTGDTADGPGGQTWLAMECDQSLSDPPRPTIRWIPEDGRNIPEHLLDPGTIEEDFTSLDDDVDEAFLDDHEFGSSEFDPSGTEYLDPEPFDPDKPDDEDD
ncbi:MULTISPECIES: DUF4261 domain-containing protein [Rhodopirellula]|jgi:hypothetical protein|uniref:DUF4261 domain-containing protein n=1 Tax=Rhodopirellula europaea SH398 TaxID=1263868 RepID=M5S225_9BACT|nr:MULTISPECIES: DUF4261 domain-containing protein [Rhodopirellula]EMI25501.1 hypothetical protein RESH_04001 [Rhodopirellula europaea SH398]MCR9207060.1 DUF4261 domain-containing protein [bacterium]|tara:strand:- start:15315 stop:16424 length:1110 start_codon:yes stop_codon:yes gene_type:complete